MYPRIKKLDQNPSVRGYEKGKASPLCQTPFLGQGTEFGRKVDNIAQKGDFRSRPARAEHRVYNQR